MSNSYKLIVGFLFLFSSIYAQIWEVDTLAPMPEAVSNNAVCEGFIGNNPYVFSFAGIDASRSSTGIHLKAFRYHVNMNSWDTIPNLPDTLGKVAASASRVGDTIYIIGGYHVFANGNEISSDKVHRYDVNANAYLPDGASIPVPIDDQVQAVWRDSLIYVITGWSNTNNVPDVQIYNPASNSWAVGTSVPNGSIYKSFGSSGTIIGDTIYYFGGAQFGFNFPVQRYFRKGVIDPVNPTQISWSDTVLDNSVVGYRMAATSAYGQALWLGGSNVTFNYDGIAYNGTGAVSPNGRSLSFDPAAGSWVAAGGYPFPMDLRGLGKISEDTFFLAGGMQTGPTVSDQLLRLRLNPSVLLHQQKNPSTNFAWNVFPNPIAHGVPFCIQVEKTDHPLPYRIHNLQGQLIHEGALQQKMNWINFPPGTGPFFISIIKNKMIYTQILMQYD